MKELFNKSIPHIIALFAFVICSVVYFLPQMESKVIPQGDMIQFYGMNAEIQKYKSIDDEPVLWTNSMFGGMPAYQIASPSKNNIFRTIENVMQLGFDRPIGYFIYAALAFYILLLCFKVNPYLAIAGALAFSFTTNNLVLFEAGHVTKIKSVISLPIVIAGMHLVFKRKFALGLLLFTLGMGLNVRANHYQMSYYMGLFLGIWVLVEYINLARKSDFKTIFKTGILFLLGLMISVGAGASKFFPTYEYAEDTMRGKPILTTEGKAVSSSQTKGLEYGYAMTWSNGFADLLSTFIPGAVGGSSGEKVSKDSEFLKILRKNGQRMDKSPTYWGSLPFTSGPNYFGILIVLFAILFFIYTKGRFKWWLLSSIILGLLLSLGGNFEPFNSLIFDYVPYYNKFRSPNSILSVTAILVPLAAMLGIQALINSDKDKRAVRSLYIASGITGGLCLILALLGSSIFSFESIGDSNFPEILKDAIYEDRISMFRSDALRSFAFVLVSSLISLAFLKGKLSKLVLIGGFSILILVDLIPIGLRYLSHGDFINPRSVERNLEPRDVDTQILRDTDPHYRVYDLSVNPVKSTTASLHHKSIGGYHAAKLQRFQDIYDKFFLEKDGRSKPIGPNNMKILNMLNTKYLISSDGQKLQAQQNPAALGNAWFISEVKLAQSPNDEIDFIENIDPLQTVIINSEFESSLTSKSFNKSGDIKLKSYSPNKLVYESNSSDNQLGVFSEIWYGPNKGWKATVNGTPTNILRANYFLRAINVPSGKNEIVFEFKPSSYYRGGTIGLISSVLFLLLVVVVVFKEKIPWIKETF